MNPKQESPPAETKADRRLRARRVASAVAILLGIAGMTLAWSLRETFMQREPLTELAESFAAVPHRSIRPRLSGAFLYAPLQAADRSAHTTGNSESSLRARVVATRHTASVDPHVSGVAHLLVGDHARAVQLLTRATAREHADIWSDLAAACLVESEQTGKVVLAIDALGAADHARRLNTRHAAAAFNRALALERLGLLEEARAAWEEYRHLDSGSSWMAEATVTVRRLEAEIPRIRTWKERLAEVERAVVRSEEKIVETIVRGHIRDARAWGEAVYTAKWAEAVITRNDVEAHRQLGFARAIGNALFEGTGERLLRDSIAVIDRAGEERRKLLADAYLTYRNGRIAYSRRGATALADLRAATRLFERAGSPMAAMGRYYEGSALYAAQRLDEAQETLDQLASTDWASRGYIALAAQIGWERGLTVLSRGSYSAAADIFAESRALFDRASDTVNATMMHELQATTLDLAGDPEQAWSIRRVVFMELARAGDRPRKILALNSAATALIARREWIRALPLLDLSVDAGRKENDLPKLASALAQRSAAHAAMRHTAEARRDLAELHERLAMMTAPEMRTGLLIDAQYAEALLVRDIDPEAAIDHLNRAISELDRAGRALFMSRLYLERSRAHRRRSDSAAAREDVAAGLAWIERNRRTVADPQLRAMALASGDELFRDGIELAVAAGHDAEAFDLAERARARSLLESFQRDADSAPLRATEIAAALHPDAAILQYAVLDGRVVAFVLRSTGVRTISIPVPQHRLRSVVDAAAAAVREPNGLSALEDGWKILIEPVAPELRGVDRIVIVADRALSTVPFAALRDAVRRRFLIDDFVLSIAPSASLAVLSSRRAAQHKGSTVLAVAATEFDSERFPNLARLQRVEGEARAVAAAYGSTAVLSGLAATPVALMRAMRGRDVIHYAGHSVVSRREPASSALVLASDGTSSTLSASDIGQLNLSRTRLVVLSSCRSAESAHRGDGIENLATAFVVAGVPSVIGALRDVDDDAAADLAVEFHRHYRVHRDAARAFHDAVSRESATNVVPSWAVIAPFGGFPSLIKATQKERHR